MTSTGLEETAEERRLRHAACLLADIGWRAHPDYRGEQSLNIIANAAFIGDRSSRPRLPRAGGVLRLRRTGWTSTVAAAARRLSPRACSTGRAFSAPRCASPMLFRRPWPGVLPRTPMLCGRSHVDLTLPPSLPTSPASGCRTACSTWRD